MPATEYQGSSVHLAFLSRPILSIRRNQIISMEGNSDQDDSELFQKHVSERFLDLSSSPTSTTTTTTSSDAAAATSTTTNDVDNFLSIAWLRKLLDVFLCCEAEFKAVIFLGRDASQISKPPLDRLTPELLDRTVKALDICNAITHGIEMIRNWQKLAEIALLALKQSPLGEGQVRRAKKALNSLLSSMTIDDKDAVSSRTADRAWSFGRRGSGAAAAAAAAVAAAKERTAGPPRLFTSWSVPKSWSASKQIQAMCSNLMMPRGTDPTGMAMPVFIMSTVLVFVTWTLVATIPCQDRSGLLSHFALPRQLSWAGPIIGLQERIAEEWKKKEKKKSTGLLDEMQRLEKCGQLLIEFADSIQFPAEEEKLEEISVQVTELAEMCRKMEEGLLPLQRQLREMFHRIVRSRTEILDVLEQNEKYYSPVL
ncbi:protein ROH1-like [Macadamia integrifolia]|uniref:protein ROH1-like n=1 Tax=Macadamia integrifolia TaxID=60698 RepID=UPI001C4E6E06|nr:protein ROH1-like [Macadamia integrifolia]